MIRWATSALLLGACAAPPALDAGPPDAGAGLDAALDASPGSDAALDAMRPLDASPPADAEAPLTPCALEDVFALSALDVSEPGSDAYVIPSETRLDALGRSIRAALDGDRSEAGREAALAEYRLCADGAVLVWAPTDETGQARIAWRRDATRGLIFEAPHPFHDLDTSIEASTLFRVLDARALIVSGTHRCASTAAGCEGRSTACGAPDGYRRSDAAHTVVATFHRAHEALSEGLPSDVVVSVHGFADDGVSTSDGTTGAVTDASPVARLSRALVAAGITGVTACNDGAGVPVEARLCGTTNTQGRHLNGSPDACGARAPGSSGRFVHLEQSRAVRADVETVVAAFEAAF